MFHKKELLMKLMVFLLVSFSFSLFADQSEYFGKAKTTVPGHEKYIAITIDGDAAKAILEKLDKPEMPGIGCYKKPATEEVFCTLTLTKDGGVYINP
jgi:hypothetical protein